MNRSQIFTTFCQFDHTLAHFVDVIATRLCQLQTCASKMKQLDKHVSFFISWTAVDAIQPCSFGNLNAECHCSWWQNHGIKNKLLRCRLHIYIYIIYIYSIYNVAVKLYFDFFKLHLFCGIGLTKTVHILFGFSFFELVWMNCGVPQIPGSLQGFVLFVVFFNQSEMQRHTHLFTDDSFNPQPKQDFKIFSWNLSRERQMELEQVFFRFSSIVTLWKLKLETTSSTV